MKRKPYMVLMWHPRELPIPRGWRLVVPQAITYHSNFAVLIEKVT